MLRLLEAFCGKSLKQLLSRDNLTFRNFAKCQNGFCSIVHHLYLPFFAFFSLFFVRYGSKARLRHAITEIMQFIERSFAEGEWRFLFVVLWRSLPPGIEREAILGEIAEWCVSTYGGPGGTRFQDWAIVGEGAFGFRSFEKAMEFKLRWVGADLESVTIK